jgi:hypothetical protein
MTWLTGEPTLDDVLADPVIHAIMARDRVDADALRGFLRDMRRARDIAERAATTVDSGFRRNETSGKRLTA